MEEVERCGHCHKITMFRQAVQLAASGAKTPCEPCTCAMEERIADAMAKRIASKARNIPSMIYQQVEMGGSGR